MYFLALPVTQWHQAFIKLHEGHSSTEEEVPAIPKPIQRVQGTDLQVSVASGFWVFSLLEKNHHGT